MCIYLGAWTLVLHLDQECARFAFMAAFGISSFLYTQFIGLADSRSVTADYTLTIPNMIWSAIGKRWGFGRFVRCIMRDIRHDNLKGSAL